MRRDEFDPDDVGEVQRERDFVPIAVDARQLTVGRPDDESGQRSIAIVLRKLNDRFETEKRRDLGGGAICVESPEARVAICV